MAKLKAATLVETLVAMTIVMIAFGVGLLVYANVFASHNNRQQVQARLLIHGIVEETRKTGEFIDEEIIQPPFILQKKISRYGNEDQLYLMNIKVLTKEEKVIAEKNELVYQP